MKLIFGDPKSIKIRDDFENRGLVNEIKKRVKCPFCGKEATDAFIIDTKNEYIGWNFGCEEDCPNSFKYGEKHGDGEARLCTNFDGKFLNIRDQPRIK